MSELNSVLTRFERTLYNFKNHLDPYNSRYDLVKFGNEIVTSVSELLEKQDLEAIQEAFNPKDATKVLECIRTIFADEEGPFEEKGTTHPDTWKADNCLAILYTALDKPDKAKECLENVVKPRLFMHHISPIDLRRNCEKDLYNSDKNISMTAKNCLRQLDELQTAREILEDLNNC